MGVDYSLDPGPTPSLDWLDPDELEIDSRYQRELTEASEKRIAKMVREFSWRDFSPVTVTPDDDGTLYVIDGQHRTEAAKRHPKISEIPAYIVTTYTLKDQAKGFLNINKNRVGITAVEKYYAELAAGDPDALHVARICEEASISITRSHRSNPPPRHTAAVGNIKEALRNFGDRATRCALDAIVLAHPETRGALSGKLIIAMAGLYRLHQDEPTFDEEHLVKVLADLDPRKLAEDAQKYREIYGGAIRDALRIALTTAYNKETRRKLKDDRPLAAEQD